MEEKINEYLSLYFIHGININNWTLVHNISELTSARDIFSRPAWPLVQEYCCDFGTVKMEKDDYLPENTFFLCPPGTIVKKRCKCCGQTILEGARMK